MNEDNERLIERRPVPLVIPAIWFAVTAFLSVVALDLAIMPIHNSRPDDLLGHLYFSKDIAVVSASLLFCALLGALLSRRLFKKPIGELSLGFRIGIYTALVSLLINPLFWVVSLGSFLLFPFLFVSISGVSGIIFGIFLKIMGLRPKKSSQPTGSVGS